MSATSEHTPRRVLGLIDSISLMVGIIIGVGIVESSGTVAAQLGSGWQVIAIWTFGGLISLCGALVYAELASAYPQEGGETFYLQRAFGGWAGFLFAWSGVLIIRPGSIAAMAFPFSRYALATWTSLGGDTLSANSEIILAGAAVIALTMLNIWRLSAAKWTQNLLTFLKVAALGALFAASFAGSAAPATEGVVREVSLPGIELALILILFTYGGWNELGYVAGEVRDYKVNIHRSIVLTIIICSAVYILVNAGFLHLLGIDAMASSQAVASDAMQIIWPQYGRLLMSIVVALSALGALNGMITTSSRISYALGQQNKAFASLAKWSEKADSPRNALTLQMCITLAIIYLSGSFVGTVVYTTAVAWSFFFLTSIAFFVLRKIDAAAERPYKVSLYPFIPMIFCAMSAYLSASAIRYDPEGSLIALAITLSGLPLYWLGKRFG